MALSDRSHFDLSHQIKTTCEMGELIPFLVQETVPGDSFRLRSNFLVRLQPLRAPIMQRISQHIRYYYVPYRILDTNFREMLIDPDSPLVVPSLFDWLAKNKQPTKILHQNNLLRAIGVTSSNGELSKDAQNEISQYFFRAYYAIYNHYYRNPLIDSDYIDDLSKADWLNTDILSIRHANWYGDYFTEAKPSTQYGTEVDIDLDNNNVVKVNELRLAEKLQRYRDKLLSIFSGTGSRYSNYLKKMYGVSPTNTELSMPLYIGGSSESILTQDVDQTSPSENEPVATTYSKSVTANSSDSVQYDCNEHGLIIGLTYILPDVSYTAGVPRYLIKSDYFDFYNSLFANIGMQEVYGLELDASRPKNQDNLFGYTERYADLKYPVNRICGDFAEELDFYHLGRNLHHENLSRDFLSAKPTNRVFSVTSKTFNSTDTIGLAHPYITYPNLFNGIPTSEEDRKVKYGDSKYNTSRILPYLVPNNDLSKSDIDAIIEKEYAYFFEKAIDEPDLFVHLNTQATFEVINNVFSSPIKTAHTTSQIYYLATKPKNSSYYHDAGLTFLPEGKSASAWKDELMKEQPEYDIVLIPLIQILNDDTYHKYPLKFVRFKNNRENSKHFLYPMFYGYAPSNTKEPTPPFTLDYLLNANNTQIHNHVLMAVHNDVDALRPIPKTYNPSIL